VRVLLFVALIGAGCGGEGAAPLFPSSYAASYVQVRNCRPSSDHDLHNIRVLADPLAAGPYQSRGAPFPEGAVVLKEEHDFADTTCTGPIALWTVMVRQNGLPAEQLGWHWQKVDPHRRVLTDEEPRCFGCHKDCGVSPDGYLGTCTVP
jgi:hypothetical protein